MTDTYVLGRSREENERLRAQARLWEDATVRLLGLAGIPPGARCLDAGCGPGLTTKLLLGHAADVTGLDIDDVVLAPPARFVRHDITADAPIPGGPYDVVFARLLLFHLPQRAEVTRRLWEAVAPGGLLILQDYELRSVGMGPALPVGDEMMRVVLATFAVAGCDVHAGTRLPDLLVKAGAGFPDGTDVAGRLVPISMGADVLEGVYRSLLPAAFAHGITTPDASAAAIDELHRERDAYPARGVLLPLMVGAWSRKP